MIPRLIKVYGEHTLFPDDEELEIIEMADTGPMGQVIELASSADQKQTTLATHQPEATEVVVVLGSDEDLS